MPLSFRFIQGRCGLRPTHRGSVAGRQRGFAANQAGGVASVGLVLAAVLVTGGGTPARADLVELIDGGILRGECLQDPSHASGVVRIRTMAGAVVDVPAEQVQKFTKRRRVVEQFELRFVETPPTVEALWELAEWAREQGLRPQRSQALEALLKVDPEHVAAHRGLGHLRQDGEWMTHEQLMQKRGFVKHKGKWVLPQEVELLELAEMQSAEEKQWYRQIKNWVTWLKEADRPDRQASAMAQLRAIRDPAAIPAIGRHLVTDRDAAIRSIAAAILAQIPGDRPSALLLEFCLKDNSNANRQTAIKALEGRDVAVVRGPLRKALRHEQNVVVNRAAETIGKLGDKEQIPALIDALITDHRYTITVPDNANTISMTSDGRFAPQGVPIPADVAGLLATGQLPQGVRVDYAPLPGEELRRKNVTILRHEQNPEVLAALARLTGENFGYNEAAWKAWLRRKQGAA